VLIEEFTGAWCQYCPDGQTVLNAVTAADPSVFGASIHNSDAMVNVDAKNIDDAYAQGYPGGLIDRFKFPAQSTVATDRTDWPALAAERKTHPVPVRVTIEQKSFNSATRELSVTLKAEFVSDVKGDFRFGAIVTENDVYNSGDVVGWSQVNFYNTQTGSEWYQKGNPIIGFKHQHVVEAMLGGAWGETGTIPANITAGQSFTKTFTYTIPAVSAGPIYRYNENNMNVIGLVTDYNEDPNDRAILNSAEASLTLGVGNISSNVDAVTVYPNPATDHVTLELGLSAKTKVGLTVYDATGRVVYQKSASELNAGTQLLDISTRNLVPGVYNLTIQTEGGSTTRRFTVLK